MKFGSPPYPALALHPAYHLAPWESVSLHSWSALRCWTLSQSRPQLAGLVPLMRKPSISNISVPPGLLVVPKALAITHFSAVPSLFAMRPLPPSRFYLLAPYCYTPSWLAPYYFPSATILLLLTGWPLIVGWHPRCPVAPLAALPSRLSDPSVTPSGGIALPQWLPPTPQIDVSFLLTTGFMVSVGPGTPGFPPALQPNSSPSSPEKALAKLSFCFRAACGRVWVSLPVRFYELLPYVSGVLVS